jgi:nucleoid-associated protein YgaU
MYAPEQSAGVTDPYASNYADTPYPYETGGTAGLGGARYHTVQKKETLYSISRQYYGDHTKWKDIYAANRSDIGDPNKIRVGQRLVIPQ